MSGTMPETVSQSIVSTLSDHAANMARAARDLADQAEMMAMQAGALSNLGIEGGGSFLVNGLTVFVLACFVGYYVVWRVTPALHSPLMGITNAISSVIIVGALIAVGVSESGFSKFMGFMAVTLASVNIFGGFIITRRMLHMFKKKG
ncbi:MAG: NAD(P) transhydrogenase subunit alpha [Rhodospirillales bacterium]|nr:NAD(P) transhydrogenase subunit alpha [Rhodospirillales bacterium]